MKRSVLMLALVLAGCSSGYDTPQPFDATVDTRADAALDAPSSAKDLTAFAIASPAATGAIDASTHVVAVTVPFSTDVSALVATFATTGAVVKVGAVVQTSNVTPNDFRSPVQYTVTAADGTSQLYTVTVAIAASSAHAITAFSLANPSVIGTIDEVAKTIAITVPFGTPTTSLVASYTTMAKRVLVGGMAQTSGVTANDFTLPVSYTAEAYDGSMATYTVTVTVAPNTAHAITSFSFASPPAVGTITGTNIAVAVPFGTNVTALVATYATSGAHVRVNGVDQTSGVTPDDFSSPVSYVVTAQDGSSATYQVTVTVALSPAKAITAFSFTSPAATGTIDEGAKTIALAVPFGTNVTALVATFATTGASVKVGAVTQASGATPNSFTTPVAYVVTAADGSVATYTVTVTSALNPAKAITAFSFASPPATGFVDEAAKTITLTVPFGTSVTALVASFTTTGANVRVGGTTQVSGTTPNNFVSPVAYVVTAADGTVTTYTVTVTVAANVAKAITAFSFANPAATGVIDEVGKTIAVSVPFQTSVTALVATFTTNGASVKVAGVTQTSGTTPNNFTSSVMYVVTAADSSTATYAVTVTVRPPLMTATGGTVTLDGDYEVHTFTASGTFQVTSGSGTIESLVVGGGGMGATDYGGGGGGGEVIHTAPGATYSGGSYPITVGVGVNNPSFDSTVTPGTSSKFETIVAVVGGSGAPLTYPGRSGASGGGGGGNTSSPTSGGSATSGFPGGSGGVNPQAPGGGGGGAGGPGGNGSTTNATAGDGGIGAASSITGVTKLYGGGGGGGTGIGGTPGVGGSGGGGNGGAQGVPGTNATPNTGGGGGGGGGAVTWDATHFSGGSGIVILRFKYR